jgi:hypothetical protein
VGQERRGEQDRAEADGGAEDAESIKPAPEQALDGNGVDPVAGAGKQGQYHSEGAPAEHRIAH